MATKNEEKRWRCAACEYRGPESEFLKTTKYHRCPKEGCQSPEDVFPADDVGWEEAKAEREKIESKRRRDEFNDCDD